jgi:hypothetical protein
VSALRASAAPTATTTPQQKTDATTAPSSTAAAGAPAATASAPSAGATAAPAATAPLSDAALEKTLLTAQELSGWTEGGQTGGGGSGDDEDFAPCGRTDAEEKYKAAHDAEKTYTKGQMGDQLALHNESYVSANQAHLSIEEARKEMKACPTWSQTEDDGSKITISGKEQSFPNIADETAAFRIKFTGTPAEGGGAFKVNGDGLLVVARLGQDLVGVFHMAIAVNREPQLDTAETESIAREAVAKFKRTA